MMAEPARKKIRTRSATDYFLIGKSESRISGGKLPTFGQVLRYLQHLKEMSCKTSPLSVHISTVVDQVLLFWKMAGIETITKRYVEERLKRDFNTWISLCKSKNRSSDPGNKREIFRNSLEKLWDIGSPNALQIILQNRLLSSEKKNEDIAFYEDQRGERKAVMSGMDKVFQRGVQRQQERRSQHERYETETSSQFSDEEFESISSSQSSTASSSNSLIDYSEPETSLCSTTSGFVSLTAPKNLINNEEITKVLDRLKISDNAATMLASAFIKACHGKVDDFCISRSTTRRSRIANRLQISESIVNEFKESPPKFLALHWDGKLTKDRYGNKFDALSVLVSGPPNCKEGKLLGVQQLESGSGKAQAEATHDLLELWNLEENIQALVFDTTAANTGWNNGAAKILESLLGRKLFYNACRHHVYELVIGAVYKNIFGESFAPENLHFKSFKSIWPLVDTSKNYNQLELSSDWLKNRAITVIQELQELISKERRTKEVLIRNDYKQCAENTLALLGVPSSNFFHHTPGATTSARWMGQVLYCQKMFMWSDQLHYERDFVENLQRINLFIALFYVPAWLKSSIGIDAPVNDLEFLQNMLIYRKEDVVVADAAYQKLSNHRWYLNEDTVAFSFFSDHPLVTVKVKESMALRLLSTSPPDEFHRGVPVFRGKVDEQTQLADLIGPETWFLFRTLNLSQDWLYISPELWPSNESFQKGKDFVSNLKVVNDAAERGVKFNQDYAAILTENEEQRRSLLQIVEKHRKEFPNFRKSTLSQT